MNREVLVQTKTFQQMNRSELVAIITRQQQEINGLRARVEALEAADIGQLRERIEELESWKSQAELDIRELQVTASMTKGLVFFLGTSLVALIGENFIEELQLLPESIDETEREEIEEKLGEAFTKIIETIKKMVVRICQQLDIEITGVHVDGVRTRISMKTERGERVAEVARLRYGDWYEVYNQLRSVISDWTIR